MNSNDDLAKKVAQLEELLASIKSDLSKQTEQGSGGITPQASSEDAKGSDNKSLPRRKVAAVRLQQSEKQSSNEIDLAKQSRGEIVINEPTSSAQPQKPNTNSGKTTLKTPLKGEITVDKVSANQGRDYRPKETTAKDIVQNQEQTVIVNATDNKVEPAAGDKDKVSDVESTVPIGEVGTFDGEFVFMANGKKYQVPPNYASKSKLVHGDQLKLLAVGDRNDFKLVKQVEREELTGILTKKDFIWTVAVNTFDFKVMSASVRYYGGDIGDKATILVPKGYEQTKPEWAALIHIEKTDVNKGGFAGSESASDIELRKKMKYVPKKDSETNQAVQRSAISAQKTIATGDTSGNKMREVPVSKKPNAPKTNAIAPASKDSSSVPIAGDVQLNSEGGDANIPEVEDVLDGVPRLR